MYLYQVINEMVGIVKDVPDGLKYFTEAGEYAGCMPMQDYLRLVIPKMRHSVSFHLGDAATLIPPTPLGQPVFVDNSEYLKLPYELCWFDWTHPVHYLKTHKKMSWPVGVLAHQLKADLLWLDVFFKIDSRSWWPSSVSLLISVGIDHIERNDDPFALIPYGLSGGEVDGRPGHIGLIGTYVPLNEEQRTRDLLMVQDVPQIVCSALLLLNCKNVETAKIEPHFKKIQRLEKQNQCPPFTYYILKVRVPGTTKIVGRIGASTYGSKRMHFCRGHLKKYSSESPLLGKHTGMYWWPAHLRGSSEKGVVMKEYEIIHEQEHTTIQ